MEKFFEVNFWEMIFRTTISFAILLFLARILGKKQLSQLTFFHYITGITIGSIAADVASQKETPFFDGIVALVWWSFLTILMSYIALKWSKARVFLDDEPTIVIKEGKILEKPMKKVRLHVDDLMMMLREQSIFSVKDVYFAVMETNGELSVMKRVDLETATKTDVKVASVKPKYLPSEIISDGKIVEKNLKEMELTEEWLMKKLRRKGIESVEDVYFAQIQTDGSLHVDLKDKKE